MSPLPLSITVEPGEDISVPFGQNISAQYTLTGPDGTRAVFNNMLDRDYVGMLTDVTGLDSPEVRESADDLVQMDGGLHGDFFFGRRPITLSGIILNPASVDDRDRRFTKIARASSAMRADAQLSWLTTAGEEQFVNVRRQQPLRVSGGWQKTFQIGLVASDPRIYSRAIKTDDVTAEAIAPTTPVTVAADDFTTFTTGVLNGRAATTGGNWATTGGQDFVPTSPTGGIMASIHSKVLAAILGPSITDTDIVADVRADNDAYNRVAARYLGPTQHVYVGVSRGAFGSPPSCGIVIYTTAGGYQSLGSLPLVLADIGAAPNYYVRVHMHVYESGVLFAELRRVSDNSVISSTTVSHAALAAGGELASGPAALMGSEYDATGIVQFDSITVQSTIGLSGIAAEMTVANNGSATSWPILQLTGPGTNPTIRNYTTGQQIAFGVTLGSTDTLLIDTFNRTILLNGQPAYQTLDFANTDWWGLAPGDNRLLLSFSDFNAGANMSIQWRDAWI
jgi:hypothetical protein